MKKIGFDNEKYLLTQTENIRQRIEQFGGKLYLEFGGKLFDDYHASRVLPGFKPDSKVQMLMNMKDDAEVLIVISANDIERKNRRGDHAITYDEVNARATGVNVTMYQFVISFLTAITVVLGMRMMGALLISSLIIFPPLTAMRLCTTFRGTVICSGILSALCFVLGMFISFFFSTPTGASVVAVNIIAFAVFAFIAKIRTMK